MILLAYALGFVLLAYLTHARSERLRSAVIIGYNFLFLVGLSFSLMYTPGCSAAEIFHLLLASIYEAPRIMGFEIELIDYARLQYCIIYAISAFYTIRTVAVLIFRHFFNDLKLKWRLRLRKEIFLVFGELNDAQFLIADIHRLSRRAAVLYMDPNPDQDDDIRIPGALTVDWARLEKLSPNHNYQVVLLPEPNHENLSLLRRLETLAQKLPQFHVTAFLDDDLMRLENLDYTHLDAWLVSREQLLSQNHLNTHRPLELLKQRGECRLVEHVYRPQGAFQLCVVGFGPLTREFLLTTYENAVFETDDPGDHSFRATIIAPELAPYQGAFYRDFPGVDADLTWVEAAPESAAFFDTLEPQLATLHQIFIDTGDTARNISTALRLLRLCRRNGIQKLPNLAVVLHDDAPGSAELLASEPCVSFLQANCTQFTYEELVRRRADQEVRALHRRYQSNNQETPDWNALATFTQASNRAVLWDIPNKLALVDDLSDLSHEERDQVYWTVSRYEHRRWNAFHFAHGWVPMAVEELSDEERAQFKTKHADQRRHICLVGWDALDALPQAKPGLIKYYDYENVAQLFDRAIAEN
jgi:hypothetical protein